jgi:hypothetical protein
MCGKRASSARFAAEARTTQTVAMRSSGQVAAASATLRFVARTAAPRSPKVFQHSTWIRVWLRASFRPTSVERAGRQLEGACPAGGSTKREDVLLDLEAAAVARRSRLVDRPGEVHGQWSAEHDPEPDPSFDRSACTIATFELAEARDADAQRSRDHPEWLPPCASSGSRLSAECQRDPRGLGRSGDLDRCPPALPRHDPPRDVASRHRAGRFAAVPSVFTVGA